MRELIQLRGERDPMLETAADQLRETCCVVSQDVANTIREFLMEYPEEVLEFIPPEFNSLQSLIKGAVEEVPPATRPPSPRPSMLLPG